MASLKEKTHRKPLKSEKGIRSLFSTRQKQEKSVATLWGSPIAILPCVYFILNETIKGVCVCWISTKTSGILYTFVWTDRTSHLKKEYHNLSILQIRLFEVTTPSFTQIPLAPMILAIIISVNSLSPTTATSEGLSQTLFFWKYSMISSWQPGFFVLCRNTATPVLCSRIWACLWPLSSFVPAELLTIRSLAPGYRSLKCLHFSS